MADNGFKCPVCLDDLNNARMLLPCTHSLCEDPCLKQLLKGAVRREISCPVCRASIAVPSQGVGGFPRNVYVGTEVPSGKVSIIESKNNSDEFRVGDVKVLLYKKSIIEVKQLDAIVSPTNSDLDLTAGVARVITNKAGDQVLKECREKMRKDGRMGVGEVFISSPGTLGLKGIIHVVGPEWSSYDKEIKNICAEDLYQTVVRVLAVVAEKGWTSVGLCAIGCGQGGIPVQLCAEMYMKAIIDSRHTGARNLREIHFVDIDSTILREMSRAHREWMTNEKALDFKNAHKYLNT